MADLGQWEAQTFGPGHPEWCPAELTKGGEPNEDHSHCSHWWDNCEPCCRCGDDTPDPGCDCPRCSGVKEAQR